MKKVIFALLFLLISLNTVVFAVSPCNMIFEKDSGGKYIYSNNREFIYPCDLADKSNENPKYIMNNEDLTADNYTLFASHVNHTETRDEYGNITKAGYDIELDVMFKAKEDTVIKINSIGFEVPKNIKYYYNYNSFTKEDEWGSFNAWASYLKMPINQKDSGKKYYPVEFEPVTVNVKAGDTIWLSKYIKNYSEVPFYRPVHIISDFEIKSGKCDLFVLAVKSNGNLKDRSMLADNIQYGKYEYDRQYKGISDNKNKVDTYLNFDIDDSVPGGTKLPVTVFNQYAKKGKTVTTWFTNLNPRADIWNKDNVAEDSMLAFEYKDESKLNYYNKNRKDKDDVWFFDTAHSDLIYNTDNTKVSDYLFYPNFELKSNTPEEYGCNLANYGVFQNYHITINNTGNIDRYLSYILKTPSNNLVILYDENGNVFEGYPITKGTADDGEKESDVLANVKIPAKKTVKFTLTVILTTNYVGGMENTLVIEDNPKSINVYDDKFLYDVSDKTFTGKEYVRWINKRLYTSEDKKFWKPTLMNRETQKLFEGQWNEYRFIYNGNGYFAKNTIYDGLSYKGVKDKFNYIYVLDEDFNLKETINMYSYINDISCANNLLYTYTDTLYYSDDFGKTWKNMDSMFKIPVYNNNGYVASYGNKTVNLSTTGIYFNPVLYDDFSVPYIDCVGDLYYFADKNVLYYSYNGVYWHSFEFENTINKISKISDDIIINDSEHLKVKNHGDEIVVRCNDTYLGLKYKPVFFEDKIYVPLESFAKIMNISLIYDEDTNNVTLIHGNKTVTLDSEQLINIDGVLYFSVRFAGEALSYDVTFNEKYNLVRLKQ